VRMAISLNGALLAAPIDPRHTPGTEVALMICMNAVNT
jgi:hypothetical protein